MSRKTTNRFDKKTLVWMILAAVAFVLVVIAIVVINNPEDIDSSYFHDDDSKIVLTMDKDMSAMDDSPYESGIVHAVYYHDGSKITNMRVFYEYPDSEMAKIAMNHLAPGDFAESKKLNGKYIIFQINKSQYENMTVDALRENIELLKGIDALILDYDENSILKHPISFPKEEPEEESSEGETSSEPSGETSDGSESSETE